MRVEQAEPRLFGLHRRRRLEPDDAGRHLGHDLCDDGRTRAELRTQIIRIAGVCVRPHDLHPRPVGRSTFALVAAARQHLRAAQPRVRRQLVAATRLADPGLTGEQHEPAPPGQRVVECDSELCHLWLHARRTRLRRAGRAGSRRRSRPRVVIPVTSGQRPRRSRSTAGARCRPVPACPPGSSRGARGRATPNAGGTAGLCQLGATGAVWRCCEMTATASSPTNGGRPVISS